MEKKVRKETVAITLKYVLQTMLYYQNGKHADIEVNINQTAM